MFATLMMQLEKWDVNIQVNRRGRGKQRDNYYLKMRMQLIIPAHSHVDPYREDFEFSRGRNPLGSAVGNENSSRTISVTVRSYHANMQALAHQLAWLLVAMTTRQF